MKMDLWQKAFTMVFIRRVLTILLSALILAASTAIPIMTAAGIPGEAPSTVSLSVDGAGTNLYSAVLKWISPYNDRVNSEGQAAAYDVRYSENPITEANFELCAKADMTIAPKPAGSSETLCVNNLTPGKTYYFAEKTAGVDGTLSDMSNVVNVTTGLQPGVVEEVFASSLAELQGYINAAPPQGLIITLKKGEYRQSGIISLYGKNNITIQGETDDYNDTVIRGAGMNNSSMYQNIFVNGSSYITIRNLTLTESYYHAIQVANGSNYFHADNLKCWDNGESGFKISGGRMFGIVGEDQYSDYGVIENCHIGFTTYGARSVIEGIDGVAAKGWLVRGNLIENVRDSRSGMYAYGLYFKGNSIDTVFENNAVINCDIGISFGNGSTGWQYFRYLDTRFEHRGGIMRNNIVKSTSKDTGIVLRSATGFKIYNNTVWNSTSYPYASICLRIADTGNPPGYPDPQPTQNGEIVNNILRYQVEPNWGSGNDQIPSTIRLENNLVRNDASLFVNAAGGDFHPAATASAAIGKGINLYADVPFDFDGAPRPKTLNFDIGAYQTPFEETLEMDAEVLEILVDGTPYAIGGAPPEIPADQVFWFEMIVKNTGTEAWRDDGAPDQRPATFLSRNPDYNSVFGTFLITPYRSYRIEPGQTHPIHSSLRAPSLPGVYTMTWQLAQWAPINNAMDWAKAPFFGPEVNFTVVVVPRTDSPPPDPVHVPGLVDRSDLEYVGSFLLPAVPGAVNDEKTYFASGITLRTEAGEKRMILTTGTYDQTVYEVAIPTPGMIVGSDTGAVPTATLRTVFGGLPKDPAANTNGTMWYDQGGGLLYWTNYHSYLALNSGETIGFPVLRAASLAGGKLTETGWWYQPQNIGGAPPKSFWGGVTGIPEVFADRYTGGKTLGLGFGGIYSIAGSASWGPAIAAVDLPSGSDTMSVQPIFNYSSANRATRDGNVFFSWTPIYNPVSPWEGKWASGCTTGSGVFIDLPDKTGYITFNRLAIGRFGYDYGGSNWNGAYENVWYFYDYETLGRAATVAIARESVEPSSVAVIDLPNDATKDVQQITGSCFDPETRLLYIYCLRALPRAGYSTPPAVHVYYVQEDVPEPVTLESIAVTANPAKAVYWQGDTLSLAGLVVTARYSDGNSHTVSGYSTSPASGAALYTIGTQIVTVSYTEGGITKTAGFSVTVNPKPTVIYIVSFNADGKVTSAAVVSGEKAAQPADPVKSGFAFDGWRTGSVTGPLYDFNTPVTANLTLYAAWKAAGNEIIITSVKTGNKQVNLIFAIKSANGKGYSVYLSETGDGSFKLYNDVNYNANSAHIKGLTNGKRYWAFIVYNDGSGNMAKSGVVAFIPG